MKESKIVLGHLACFMAYVIFGLNIVVCKDLTASNTISPLALFSLRSAGAAIIFWLLSLFSKGEKMERGDLFKIFLASMLGFVLTQVTFLMAISDITPMDCSVLASLSPIYTMFIAAVALKEPITVKKVSGVLISLAGVLYLIIGSASRGGETKLAGVLLMVVNSVSFALYLGIFKPLIGKYSLLTFIKWIFLFATAVSLPFTFTEIVRVDFFALPPEFIWELLFLILFATILTYSLVPFAQKHIRPTLVSMYSYVQPIVAIVLSIMAGMDSLTFPKLIATVMVFGGVVIVSFSKSKVEN